VEGGSDFEDVRRDPDPLRRGRRATDLLTVYQQRATELARLRRAAIEEAYLLGMSYTEIASALGITKGRVTQIRSTAPAPERALFGVGPVSIGVPYRYRTTDRERPLIAAEDAQTGEELEQMLTAHAFAVSRYQIEPTQAEPPPGDTIVVCGPKSAAVGANLISRDPALKMVNYRRRWWISDRRTSARIGSPSDEARSLDADVAYIARHVIDGRVVLHIAGIHAIGSLGAVHFLRASAAELFEQAGDRPFSLAVRADYDGLVIVGSELVVGPYLW